MRRVLPPRELAQQRPLRYSLQVGLVWGAICGVLASATVAFAGFVTTTASFVIGGVVLLGPFVTLLARRELRSRGVPPPT